MAITLTKTLYVGIGGTGVEVLLKIKKCFIDSYGEVPPMIGFLAIDSQQDSFNKSETSNFGEAIKMDANEQLFISVENAKNVYDIHKSEFAWMPSQNLRNLSLIQGFGCGQVRTNGRFVALYNKKKVQDAIISAITRINAVLPLDSKYVSSKTGEINATINVFSSVAGGTGSGMLIDVLAMVNNSLSQHNMHCRIFPWILLPDIFRTMNQGPAMNNVYYNAYGTLRDLDYIQHANEAVEIGGCKVDHTLFNYAFVFNNFNLNNTSFTHLNELTEVMAKCAFLPANEMGTDLNTPFDNVMNSKLGGAFLVPAAVANSGLTQKDGWAAGAGAAELLYDSKVVGNALGYSLISKLCRYLCNYDDDGSLEANMFVDKPEVMIRENNNRDDVTDKLLTPIPTYMLQIDKDTDINNIQAYLDAQYGQHAENVKRLSEKYKEILNNSKTEFDKYLNGILSGSNGVGRAIAFISSLSILLMEKCNSEMISEAEELRSQLNIDRQWDVLLSSVTYKGLKALFGDGLDHDAIDVLQSNLDADVRCHLEYERRIWAQRFYVAFNEYITKELRKVQDLKNNIETIQKQSTNTLMGLQQKSSSDSLFTVFLHKDDVYRASSITLSDSVKTQFLQKVGYNVPSWKGFDINVIQQQLKSFVEGLEEVQGAFNKDIEEVLRSMPKDKVSQYIGRLKDLSSELWKYDLQGYAIASPVLDRFFIIGVKDRNNSIFSEEEYRACFRDSGNQDASIASTNQKDRVYVLSVNALLPIFAVKNLKAYKQEDERRSANNGDVVNYIDGNLYQRIKEEGFDVYPYKATRGDESAFRNWVLGFVFGFIKYDEVRKSYVVKSQSYGDPIDGYYYRLGDDRTMAYSHYCERNIGQEVEAKLNQEMKDNGTSRYMDTIKSIKKEGNYLPDFCSLSPSELDNIQNPHYKAINELLRREIDYINGKCSEHPFVKENQ